MWGMATPAIVILGFGALVTSVLTAIGLIGLITMFGNAIGLGS